MSKLVETARRSGFAFETSPSGRWVRIPSAAGDVYVVEGAWGSNYLVWAGGESQAEGVERYLHREEAMKAVRRLAS